MGSVLSVDILVSEDFSRIASWGQAVYYNMGVGYKLNNQTVPVAFTLNEKIKEVVAAISTSYALTVTGRLYAWGGNGYGQLAQGYFGGYSPKPMLIMEGVKQVCGMGSQALALKYDGTVWAWCANYYGHLGYEGSQGHEQPGFKTATPVQILGLPQIKQIAMGGCTDAALDYEGNVWTWGQDKGGQCALGSVAAERRPTKSPLLSGVEKVALGGKYNNPGHLLALLNDGSVLAVGEGISGQLGNGIAQRSLVPVPVQLPGPATDIATSIDHCIALVGGVPYCWGLGTSGQCGDGTTVNKLIPVSTGLANIVVIAAGLYMSLAADTFGNLYAWGNNEPHSELGDGTTTNRLAPVLIPGVTNVQAVSAGQFHCTVLGDAPSGNYTCVANPDGTLTASWTKDTPDTARWKVALRPVVKPTALFQELQPRLPEGTRSVRLSSYGAQPLVLGQLYEVRVGNEGFTTETFRITTVGTVKATEEEPEEEGEPEGG